MDRSILTDFPLPDEAIRDLSTRHLNEENLGTGVSLLTSGHDRGLSYRFFVHQERLAVISEETDFPHYESYDMIEWYRDSKNRITEQVRMLPKELLRFDKLDGSCTGGMYKDAYDRFKAGLSAPGLGLRKWNVIPDYLIAALEELGIFTVEQFAAQPRNRIEGRFPKELQDAFQIAIEYVNGKDSREQAAKQADQLMSVMNENAKLHEEMAALRDQMEALVSGQEIKPKKAAIKRKKAA